MAVQGDGKVLIGGSFFAIGGVARSGLVRLNPDGSVDPTWPLNVIGAVNCLAAQPDGKILAAGSFSRVDPNDYLRIARFNASGSLDTSFNPGASNAVNAMVVQPDGKILVAGSFTGLAGQACNRIGRLTTAGVLENTFSGGATAAIQAIALQTNGAILVGGSFNTLGGQPCARIGRFDAEGNLDLSFNPGAGSTVRTLVVQPDGKILVGGDFSTLAGQSCFRIGRLNADGTLDGSFAGSASNSVYSIALQTDGKILVAGAFTTLSGASCHRIGRLNADGTFDPTFNPGASNTVHAITIQSDGKVLLGGAFTNVAGSARLRIARLNNTTAPTQSLAFATTTIDWVRQGTVPEVGRTLFDSSTNNLSWEPLGTGIRVSNGWQVPRMGLPTGATIRARGLVTGGQNNGSAWFVETIMGRPVITGQPVARTNNATTTAIFAVTAEGVPLGFQWLKNGTPLADSGGISGSTLSTLTLSNLLGGDIAGYSVIVSNSYGSVTSAVAQLKVIDPIITNHPASLFVHAGQNAQFNVGVIGTPPSYRWRKDGITLSGAIAAALLRTNVQWADRGNYDVVVTNAYGAVTSQVAALTVNVAAADGFNPASGMVQAMTLALQADGGLLTGGYFPNTGGTPPNFLVRVTAEGVADNTFDPNADYYVHSFAVQDNGKILIGGSFVFVSGQPRPRLTRLTETGSLDGGFDPATGGSGDVYCLVSQPDGRIIVGGSLTTIGGEYRAGLARIHPDGSLDVPFNPQPFGGSVWAIAVQPDGRIIVGGHFIQLGGQNRTGIGRINSDGTLDATFNPQLVAPQGRLPTVNSLVLQPDGKILVGGIFTTLAGHATSFIGRLHTNGAADTTFTASVGGGSYPEVYSLALQTDGKVILGGEFTDVNGLIRSNLARVNTNGLVDEMFMPQPSGNVLALALQPDGNVVVGGMFTTIGGQSRASLARLANTAPATQTLSYNGNTVTWLRGVTSPEVWRTTFETTTNGAFWTALGNGARIPGGWQLTNVPGLTNLTVRARGYVIGGGGGYRGSSWFLESALTIAPQTRPNILVNDPSFGAQSNRFGFKITALSGQVIVTEASSDLQSWTSLSTNWVVTNVFYFMDPRPMFQPGSFYRARLR